ARRQRRDHPAQLREAAGLGPAARGATMNDESALRATDIDVLVFQVGSRRFAADAGQVIRIDRANAVTTTVDALGQLEHGNRALVFHTEEGERGVRVDGVHGVRGAPLEALRRLPPAAAAPSYALGF